MSEAITAAEPTIAGGVLIGIGAASNMALFSACGGALIGAGISIAVIHSQLSGWGSRARRFLTSVFGGAVLTLAGLEAAEHFAIRLGPYSITATAMIVSFLTWKLFTVLHNRSTVIVNNAVDKALSEIGVPLDKKYVDSGPASQWKE